MFETQSQIIKAFCSIISIKSIAQQINCMGPQSRQLGDIGQIIFFSPPNMKKNQALPSRVICWAETMQQAHFLHQDIMLLMIIPSPGYTKQKVFLTRCLSLRKLRESWGGGGGMGLYNLNQKVIFKDNRRQENSLGLSASHRYVNELF